MLRHEFGKEDDVDHVVQIEAIILHLAVYNGRSVHNCVIGEPTVKLNRLLPIEWWMLVVECEIDFVRF